MIHVLENGIRRQHVGKRAPMQRMPEGYVRPNGPHPEGYIHGGHQHYADHWMVVRQGPLIVRVESPEGNHEQFYIEAPNLFFVRREYFHEIEVLGEVGEWDCLFTGEQLADADVAPELAHREAKMIEVMSNARDWGSMEFTSEVEPTYISCQRSLKWASRIQAGDVIPVAKLNKDGERLWKVHMRVKAMKVRPDYVSVVLEALDYHAKEAV